MSITDRYLEKVMFSIKKWISGFDLSINTALFSYKVSSLLKWFNGFIFNVIIF